MRKLSKVGAVSAAVLAPLSVFAEGTTMSEVSTSIVTEVGTAIGFGLAIFGSIAAIRYGIRAFKAASRG